MNGSPLIYWIIHEINNDFRQGIKNNTGKERSNGCPNGLSNGNCLLKLPLEKSKYRRIEISCRLQYFPLGLLPAILLIPYLQVLQIVRVMDRTPLLGVRQQI